ncbi:MAG: hypothetical protein MJ174_02955 [Treponema sp.]|nr:hypothetical protein [Treponema sp.]
MKNLVKSILFSVFFVSGLFVSCNDFYNNPSPESKGIVITGMIDSENNRSAYPENPDEGVSYAVRAEQGTKKIEGTVVENGGKRTFVIALPNGGVWELYAEKIKNDEIILSDYYKTDSLPETSTTITYNFNLRPNKTATGKVDLTITVDSSVKSVEVICNDEDWNATKTLNGTTVTIKSDSIKSKNYSLEINFYNSTTVKNPSTLLFNTHQDIFVYDNLTTTTWYKSGSEGYITTTGAMEITTTVINNFIQTVQYVDENADEENQRGTWQSPFKTVATAAKILNVKSTGGTIFVSGTTQESETINIQKSVTIKQWPDKPAATIERAVGADNKAVNQNSMIMINSTGDLTLDKIILDGKNLNGGKNNDDADTTNNNSGCGIYNNNGNVSIKDSTIKNFSIESQGSGGGIYSFITDSTKTFTLNNSKVYGCKAMNGGGIYNAKGKLVVTNGSVIGDSVVTIKASGVDTCSNYASSNGGGIYNDSDGTLNISGTSASSYVAYNYSLNDGGGIYNTGSLIVEEGRIQNNASGQKGKGIYDNGNLEFVGKSNGNPYISSNNDIYVDLNKTIVVKGNIDSDPSGKKYSPANPFAIVNIPDGNAGKQIISNPINDTLSVAANYTKFNIVQEQYGISKQGKVVIPVFVAGSGSSLGAGNDSNTGYKTRPIATLVQAITLIKNDSTREGIYLSGIITYSGEILFGGSNVEYEVSDYDGTAELKRGNASSFIKIISKTTFNDVKFNGSSIDTAQTNGYGIKVSDATAIFNNCTMSNYINRVDIAGIYVYEEGNVQLNNISVSNCTGNDDYGVFYVEDKKSTLTFSNTSNLSAKVVTNGTLNIENSSLSNVDAYGNSTQNDIVVVSGSRSSTITAKNSDFRIKINDRFTSVTLIPYAYPTKNGSAQRVMSGTCANYNRITIPNDSKGLPWKVNSAGNIETNLSDIVNKDKALYPIVQCKLNTNVGGNPPGWVEPNKVDISTLPNPNGQYYAEIKEYIREKKGETHFYINDNGTLKYTYTNDVLIGSPSGGGFTAFYYQVTYY